MTGYPAEYIIRRRVKENRKWIMNMVDGRELLQELAKVVPQEQIHHIRDKDAKREATQELIDILEKSQRPERWTFLLQALEENDYPYMASVLKSEEEIENFTMKVQRHCIDCNCKEIEERIDSVDIARFLLQFGTLTRSDLEQVEQVMEAKGRTHAARKLLSLMPNREKYWYKHFLLALHRNNFVDLCVKIRKFEKILATSMSHHKNVNRPFVEKFSFLKNKWNDICHNFSDCCWWWFGCDCCYYCDCL